MNDDDASSTTSSITAPPPSPPPLVPQLTLPELQARVRENLRQSGIIDTILAHLRSHLLSTISASTTTTTTATTTLPENLLLNSLIVDFLKCQGFLHTLAIFLPESHMLVKHQVLSRQELARLLSIPLTDSSSNSSSLLQFLTQRQPQLPSSIPPPTATTATTLTTSTQTQTQTDNTTTTSTTPTNPPAQLLTSLQYEERLRHFQQECDARAQRDLAAEMQHFRETELTHLRLEEAAKHRRELLMLREELQRDYDRRVEQVQAHAREEEKRVQARLQAGEATQYQARQTLLKEIEAIRTQEGDLHRAQAELEEARRQLDKEQQEIGKQTTALATQRQAEIEAARKEGAAIYATQLQSLQLQQQFLQEETRKIQAERLRWQEQMGELSSLRREVQELRLSAQDTEMLQKEKERAEVEKARCKAQEQEAWKREQEAEAMRRGLERAHAELEAENETLRRQGEEDEVEMGALREEAKTLRRLLATSRKALDCLQQQQQQQPVAADGGAGGSHLLLPSSSVPRRSLSVAMPLPRSREDQILSFSSSSSSLCSPALESALQDYEEEIKKLRDARQGLGGLQPQQQQQQEEEEKEEEEGHNVV